MYSFCNHHFKFLKRQQILQIEESKSSQMHDEACLTQGINFKSAENDKVYYNITRKRSISSLQVKDKSISPNTLNYKEKHQMYKKDLLTEKFQNLHLNQHLHQGQNQKPEKKPLRLKIERANKQNNFVISRQINEIKDSLQIKFQAQNSLLRRSIDRMQRIMSRSSRNNQTSQIEHFQNNNHRVKQSQTRDSQDDKIWKVKACKLEEEKSQLQEEIKKMKTVNAFLTSENYKLSIQNSMLKNRILQSQQNDYDNAIKTACEISQKCSSQSQLQRSSMKFNDQKMSLKVLNPKQNSSNNGISISKECILKGSDKKQNKQSKFYIDDRQNKEKKENNLINSIQTQTFSLRGRQIQESQNQHFQVKQGNSPSNSQNICQKASPKAKKPQNEELPASFDDQSLHNLKKQFQKLVFKINDLQQQINEQKHTNQGLSNQIAYIKLKSQYEKRPYIADQENCESAVSIQMQIDSDQAEHQIANGFRQDINYSENDKVQQNFDVIKQSVKKIQHQLRNLSCKGTKSKILSNQIIYFAQNISNSRSELMQNPIKNKSQKQKTFQPSLERNTQNQTQKMKTQGMKKLQIMADQLEKRRKTITSLAHSTLLTKPLPTKNSLSFYSNQKMSQLEIIRETVSLKFRAFKYTFELFQNQMIQWPTSKAKVSQLKSILEEYPFFLDQGSISTILAYCNVTEGKDVKVDFFCNKIKQFIKQYEDLTQEEEVILEKKIYKRWKYTKQELMQVLKKYQTCPGEIRKDRFVSAFEEFKFQERQIHYLLCQTVAISSDINHIKYSQYFQNFLSK